MRALGVYIFAGGFTVGVKRAGFEVLGHLEDGPFGVATTEANHPELSRASGSIHTDPATWPLELYAGKVDFVYGNPPCAPWSQAGMSPKHKRGLADNWWERDPRVSCVYQMFRVLETVRPRVWAWESVARAATAGRPLIDSLAARAAALGYSMSIVLLNGADTGVPQDRKRVFVVFHNVRIDWTRPTARRVSVREVLAAVKPQPDDVAGRFDRSYLDLLPHVPQGGSLAITYNRIHGTDYEQGKRVKGRPAFLYRRLAWDQLAFTTTGDPKHFHPEEPRLLTVREQAAICGYPPDYVFLGNAHMQFNQLSKAVLPQAGEWLAQNVMTGLTLNVPTGEPTTQVVDFIADSVREGTLTTSGVRTSAPSAQPTRPPREPGLTRKGKVAIRPERPTFEPAVPAQASTLPVWETFSGPTALAKVLIAEGADDGPILAATAAAIRGAKAAGVMWPHLFTRTDLQRLRARLSKESANV